MFLKRVDGITKNGTIIYQTKSGAANIAAYLKTHANKTDDALKQGEHSNDERFNFIKAAGANSDNERATSANTKRGARIIRTAIPKPNTKISGYIKNALTKYGAANMSIGDLASWHSRFEMFLHSDASFFVGELKSSSPNVMRWTFENAYREQSRATATALNQIIAKEQGKAAKYQQFGDLKSKEGAILRSKILMSTPAGRKKIADAKALIAQQMQQITQQVLATPLKPTPPSPPPKKRRGR